MGAMYAPSVFGTAGHLSNDVIVFSQKPFYRMEHNRKTGAGM